MRPLRGEVSFVLALLAQTLAWGQSAISRFEDYPAREIYRAPPRPLRLNSALAQKFASEIRDGITDAHGRANFAGHMIVAEWGCGAPCLRMAVVDAQTGEVYYPPITFEGAGPQSFDLPLLAPPDSIPQNPDVRFQLDSNLMIIRATPSQLGKHSSYTFYFVWRQKGWSLLRKAPLVAP